MSLVTTSDGPVELLESGRGTPVLILHGTPGGSDQALAAAHVLGLTATARVLAPSRPGYLGTPLSTGRTPAEQADAMVAVLDELGVESAAVLGASGGGMAAVALAARHPARVRGLVLWSAVTAPMRIPVGPLLHGPLAWESTGAAMVRLVRRFPRLLVGRATHDPRSVEAAMAIAETVFPIGPRRDGLSNDSRQARAFDPRLAARITAPTLIVHGTKDRNVAYTQATRAAQSIPHAELFTVHGANHWTTMADQDAQDALHRFLATVAAAEPHDR
ncbi:alpha/beta fold hydrolase [Nocardioides sp.]|uniref:alpha/beta fold hydrolase n=1 Tax=Nocardioides sp. TaxID=35761 RepID=UPI003D0EB280